jgi:phage shock protein E
MAKLKIRLQELPKLYFIIAIPILLIGGLLVYGYFNQQRLDNEEEIAGVANANARLRIYDFWGNGCPHCAKANEFLKPYVESKDGVVLQDYEVYYSKENQEKQNAVAEKLGVETGGVPLIIVGDQPFQGFDSADKTGEDIKERVEYCLENGCPDVTGETLGLEPLSGKEGEVKGASEEVNESDSMFVNLNPAEADNLIKERSDLEVIDLRTQEEVDAGIITKNITNIDFYKQDFESKIDELNKEKPYLIYCNSGNRSGETFEMMKDKGFEKVYHLDGGIQDWQSLGLELI